MFLDLNDERGSYEATEWTMYDVLPEGMAAFLAPAGCEWDAPLEGEPWPTPPIPGPEVTDLSAQPSRGASLPGSERVAYGSNNWAVAGSRTEHGGALLASDMHLGIAVPVIWFRAVLEWPDWRGGTNRVTGVTLPGAPAVVAGSNTHVAWGFTNSYGDWVDLVLVEPDPRDRRMYLTPDGPVEYARVVEEIEVKDGPAERLEILTTIWGPVIERDHERRALALRWTAHDTEAANLDILQLESARTIEDVLQTAPLLGIPPQNCVTVDESGRIGWTIAGRIPRRKGFDGRLPVSWADGTRGWSGWLEPEEYPSIRDPASGIIWTANARVVDGPALDKIGHGGYELGARATQIRDGLLAREVASERSMLELQLDDRALFLSRWRDLLIDLLDEQAVEGSRSRTELRRLVDETWTGHASVDSTSYRLVRTFRLAVFAEVYGWLTAPCLEADPGFDFNQLTQWEGPLWKLVTERPAHLLDARYDSWEQALLEAADRVVQALPKPLSERTWGERNTTAIKHPLSHAVPALGILLDMPEQQIPGDSHMPRVIDPDTGASERLVVSPGKEQTGIFHMPCGQSGHFLSPHYSDGHQAWVRGDPTPFLPGPTLSVLTLVP
jgi:penicillin amidase